LHLLCGHKIFLADFCVGTLRVFIHFVIQAQALFCSRHVLYTAEKWLRHADIYNYHKKLRPQQSSPVWCL
jgi:hypothetical protein